jgi:hypothetical protein
MISKKAKVDDVAYFAHSPPMETLTTRGMLYLMLGSKKLLKGYVLVSNTLIA